MKTVFLPFLLVLLVLSAVLVKPAFPVHAQDEAGWLLGQINGLRASKGLSPLAANGALSVAAQGHSAYLANNTWTDPHVELNGSTPRSRMAAAGYQATYMGENVYGGGMATASIAYNWWLNSPVHYAGLVSPNYTEVGIGIASGSYGKFYTLDFGGGGGAAPPQPPAAPPASGGNSTNPVARPPATRAPTRRPQPTAIPTNTPGPSLTPSQTFTPIPSKPPTETPVIAPTETAIIFELNPTSVPAEPTNVKVAAIASATAFPSPVFEPTTPSSSSAPPAETVQAVAALPTATPAPLKLSGAAIDPNPAQTIGGSDPVRSILPLAIGAQVIVLAVIVLRRSKQ